MNTKHLKFAREHFKQDVVDLHGYESTLFFSQKNKSIYSLLKSLHLVYILNARKQARIFKDIASLDLKETDI